jgi:hypothetical protein
MLRSHPQSAAAPTAGKQLFSDLPPEVDLTADIVDVSEVPGGDITRACAVIKVAPDA